MVITNINNVNNILHNTISLGELCYDNEMFYKHPVRFNLPKVD